MIDSSKPAERAEGIRGFLEEKELLEDNSEAVILYFKFKFKDWKEGNLIVNKDLL